MKVLMINVVCGIRSTGRICTDLATALEAQGHEVKIAYGRETVPEQYQKYAVRIGTDIDVKLHALKARLFDACGWGSKRATEKLIEWVKEFDPDVIHLHNLHGYYINIEALFKYLRVCKKQIVWSFYDCWAFTGHCAHYDFHGCMKWKDGCYSCKFSSEYPRAIVANAKRNYWQKKELFSSIPNMQITVPSLWMRNQVEVSFLNQYPISLLPNGIDVYRLHRQDNNLREKLSLSDKFVILGVSTFWNKEKGIEYFNKLAERLNPHDYVIVLVGSIDTKQAISEKIIKVGRVDELNSYYSMADVFVNPTLQETQGLTSIEALSCGTPVIVFNSGGAAECVTDQCGIVVDRDDFEGLFVSVVLLRNGGKKFNEQDCRDAAEKYDKNLLNESYLILYQQVVSTSSIHN